MKRTSLVFLSILFVLALSSLACQSFVRLAQEQPPVVETVVVTIPAEPVAPPAAMQQSVPDLVSLEISLTDLYERINPGVVAIRVLSSLGGSQGSGFVIDKDGHIITNYHVVEEATRVEVAFPSGLKAYGTILGTDTDSDLAVIKVDAPPEELFPLPLGDSDQIKVGQTVVAIGNPFGLSGTMTIGIVSGKGRTLESLRAAPSGANFTAGDVIQTDAAINPGNSGGPLLNLQGEVIGVNRAIRTNNFNIQGEPTNSGIGFAVSVNIVKRVVPSLIAEGNYNYPYLGISALPEITLAAKEELSLPVTQGVYVTEVTPNSPAAQAGIRVQDILVEADGRQLRDFSDMIAYLFNNKSPGDTVDFKVLRNGREVSLTVALGSRP
jgi:S1-C subfamily serine protease